MEANDVQPGERRVAVQTVQEEKRRAVEEASEERRNAVNAAARERIAAVTAASEERKVAVEVAQVEKETAKKINFGLIITVIFLAAVLLTLAIIAWDINERAKEREAAVLRQDREERINEYLNCLQLFASGVEEKSCAKYRDWINSHTNIKGL